MLNDAFSAEVNEVLARLERYVDDGVDVEVEDKGVAAEEAFSRRLRRLRRWGLPAQYCEVVLPVGGLAVVDEGAERGVAGVRGWLDGMAGRGMLAVILGLRGTGKTVSVCHLARGYGYERVWYFTGDGLYRERLAEVNMGGRFERDFMVQVGGRRRSLLILDEFQRAFKPGAVGGMGRDLSVEYVEEVINARYDAEVDTVVVANWSAEDFNALMPDSIKDRVVQRGREGRGGVRWCGWGSFRRR